MKKLTRRELLAKMKQVGLIGQDGKLILFSAFKNLASVHTYGKGRKALKIVFVGLPKENLFGFYVMQGSELNNTKEAYAYLVDYVTNGNDEPYLLGDIQWGNCGIPIGYGRIRYSEPK